MCCAVEAALGTSPCCVKSCHDDTKKEPKEDACSVVEDGHYQPSLSNIKIAPSLTYMCACCLCVRAIESDGPDARAVYVAEITRPRDWVPTWQFERRAAAPAHAPDSLIA
jgi:hypothetical protein